jgi:hypothetical protein
MPKTEVTYTDEELGLSEGWDEQLDTNIRRELKQARIDRLELKSANAELSTYRRVASFSTAGVPSDVKGQAFAKVYEGSDDPAEVKAAYEALFGPITEAGNDDAKSDTAADKRIADATSAGTSQGLPGTKDFADALKEAKTTKEVLDLIKNAPEGARSPDGYRMRLPDDQ